MKKFCYAKLNDFEGEQGHLESLYSKMGGMIRPTFSREGENALKDCDYAAVVEIVTTSEGLPGKHSHKVIQMIPNDDYGGYTVGFVSEHAGKAIYKGLKEKEKIDNVIF